jgi:monoamine oxidase
VSPEEPKLTDTQVAIVGGGLSGLDAARLMWEAGAAFQLFKARDRLGGRILTVDAAGAPSDDGFERMSREPPQRYAGSAQEPQSMRLVSPGSRWRGEA